MVNLTMLSCYYKLLNNISLMESELIKDNMHILKDYQRFKYLSSFDYSIHPFLLPKSHIK